MTKRGLNEKSFGNDLLSSQAIPKIPTEVTVRQIIKADCHAPDGARNNEKGFK